MGCGANKWTAIGLEIRGCFNFFFFFWIFWDFKMNKKLTIVAWRRAMSQRNWSQHGNFFIHGIRAYCIDSLCGCDYGISIPFYPILFDIFAWGNRVHFCKLFQYWNFQYCILQLFAQMHPCILIYAWSAVEWKQHVNNKEHFIAIKKKCRCMGPATWNISLSYCWWTRILFSFRLGD